MNNNKITKSIISNNKDLFIIILQRVIELTQHLTTNNLLNLNNPNIIKIMSIHNQDQLNIVK